MRLGLSEFVDGPTAAHVHECRAFYAARTTGRGPQSTEEVVAARARHDAEPTQFDAGAVVLNAEAGDRQVPVRAIVPDTQPTGVLLDIHGGGFYMGSAIRSDIRNRQLADSLGTVVVSVDYRLAPECPWPAAPDDCETAALWLLERSAELFGTDRLVVGGASAGSTLATTTLLRLRDRDLVGGFVGAALEFGTYDLSATTPAGKLIADEYFLGAYVGHVDDRTVPDISPVFADLADLPPILMVIGQDDILLDDNFAFAGRLSAAGNDVDLRVYPASPHGFTGHPTMMAAAARVDIESWLRGLLAD